MTMQNPMTVKTCEQYPDCKDEDRKNIEFRASVLEVLKNIESSIAELKADKRGDNADIWGAISSMRDQVNGKMDKKDVYAAITATGVIVGVIGFIVQMAAK